MQEGKNISKQLEDTQKLIDDLKRTKPLNHITRTAVIVGNKGVGKSHFLKQWTQNISVDATQLTFGSKSFDWPQKVKLQCWELSANVSQFIARMYIPNAHLTIIIVDATLTFEEKKQQIKTWREFILNFKTHGQIGSVIILQNKIDLKNAIALSENEVKEILMEGEVYIPISAETKMNLNILEIKLYQLLQPDIPSLTEGIPTLNDSPAIGSPKLLRRAAASTDSIPTRPSYSKTMEIIKSLDEKHTSFVLNSINRLLQEGPRNDKLTPYEKNLELIRAYGHFNNVNIEVPPHVNNWITKINALLTYDRISVYTFITDKGIVTIGKTLQFYTTSTQTINSIPTPSSFPLKELLATLYQEIIEAAKSCNKNNKDGIQLFYEYTLCGFIEYSVQTVYLETYNHLFQIMQSISNVNDLEQANSNAFEILKTITNVLSERREGSPSVRRWNLFGTSDRSPDHKALILNKISKIPQNQALNNLSMIFDAIIVAAIMPSNDPINSQNFYANTVLPIVTFRIGDLSKQLAPIVSVGLSNSAGLSNS